MKHPSRNPAAATLSFMFIVLITLLLCSCEKDDGSSGPPNGTEYGPHFDGIYIGQTADGHVGHVSIAGAVGTEKVVLMYEEAAWIYYYVGSITGIDSNPHIIWSNKTSYSDSDLDETTVNPSVSISDNNVVACAFQTADYSGNPSGHIYAGIGTINGNSIDWNGFTYANISGYYPSISISRDGQYAVMVYQDSQNGGNLYYTATGVNASSNAITWSAGTFFAMGWRPAIAMNDKDQVITTFNSWQNNSGLWYSTGTLNRASLSVGWGSTHGFSTSANKSDTMGGTSVGISNYNAGGLGPAGSDVFVIYPCLQQEYYNYEYGAIDPDNGVEWQQPPYTNDTGAYTASVTIACQDTPLEVYQDATTPSKMYYFFYQ
jgi:hypothetical protein